MAKSASKWVPLLIADLSRFSLMSRIASKAPADPAINPAATCHRRAMDHALIRHRLFRLFHVCTKIPYCR